MNTKNKYSSDSEHIINLADDIAAFIQNEPDGSDDKFNQLALRLFEYQFNANTAYNKYCVKRNATPETVKSWMDIPAVPTTAFKEIPLCCFPPDNAVKVLTSSGTTDQTKRSTLYYDELGLKMLTVSAQETQRQHVFVGVDKVRAMLFAPPPQAVPNLALANFIPIGIAKHLIGQPNFYVNKEGLDFPGLVEGLKKAQEENVPVILLGATFTYVHFIDFCSSQGISFNLPEGSIFQDGGGYKGQAREIGKEEFLKMVSETFGLPDYQIINSYGMSEMTCGFTDNVLYNHVNGIDEPRFKMIPHCARTVIVDPEKLEPIAKGKTGLLRHYCLGNFSNVIGVQTDDLGHETGSGFEVTGRAKGAEARGCSIAADELISAQKT